MFFFVISSLLWLLICKITHFCRAFIHTKVIIVSLAAKSFALSAKLYHRDSGTAKLHVLVAIRFHAGHGVEIFAYALS